jgi:serine/threonine protein kinase
MTRSDPWKTIPPTRAESDRPPGGCLSPVEIQRLVTGSLPTPEGVSFAEHLAHCPRCREEADDQAEFDEIRRGYQSASAQRPAPKVPNHEVEEWLGGGGFGEVWRGRHPGLNQPRAFKVLHAEHLNSEILARLYEEGRVMAALPPHPNRVQVFDLLERPEGPVLVMAFVDGGPLSRQAPMPWERAVRFVLGVGEGLREVHGRGLLHRDIKPANLLWDRDRDLAMLGDFGLAAYAGGRAELAGTPGYLAPELLDEPASVKSDVFALAATLFHLVAGKPPFATRDPYTSLLEARAGLSRPHPALGQLPRGMEEVIRAGLEPDLARRADLERFLARLQRACSSDLADRLRTLSECSRCSTKLQVAVSASPVQPLAFRPVLSCSNRDAPAVARVRPGEVLRLEVTSDADGHLTVLNFSDAGKLDVLVPGPLSQDDALRVGQTQRLTVRLTPPGPDQLALIWMPRPNRLSPRQWGERIAAGRLGEAERGVEFLLHESDVTPDDWSAVVLTVTQQEP